MENIVSSVSKRKKKAKNSNTKNISRVCLCTKLTLNELAN